VNHVVAFLRNQDFRRIAGFGVGAVLFAGLAAALYSTNVDHEYSRMFLCFVFVAIAVIFALIMIYGIVEQLVYAGVNRAHRG
jgi:uncharacterized membrane protein